MENKTFKELFYDTDLMVVIDVKGKVMYYEDYNDSCNMLKSENVIGRSIYELYPYFSRNDFTIFRAMDSKRPILNDYQSFVVNGAQKQTMNSAFPLINESGVIGGIVISVELPRNPERKKKDKRIAKYDFDDILTQNKEFRESLDILKKVSRNDSNVLIFGETGTGKELIAHSIHNNSRRKNKPLIIQNCASIPTSIMESILFGTAKGSFTGAVDKAGLFEAAQGGSIFLDEINSMPLDLQSKVLRTIENKSLRRIGETAEREIDVRIIASTNENLAAKVDRQEFRMDLFYRLNVFSFTIPPLRARLDDIPLLCRHYISHYNSLLNKKVEEASEEVIKIFMAYRWKGNVRELKNVIEYALNMKDAGLITKKDLPSYMFETDNCWPRMEAAPHTAALEGSIALAGGAGAAGEGMASEQGGAATFSERMNELEESLIRQAYEGCSHNVMKTARTLKMPRQTLYTKLKKYGFID